MYLHSKVFMLKLFLIEISFDFQRGFVTGGADKSVKFWDFELVKDENSTQKRWVDIFCVHFLEWKWGAMEWPFDILYHLLGSKELGFVWICILIYFFLDVFCGARLSVKQTRTLQLDEDVLCVSYSPNQKLLAVSLLDCTVKIFYVDTLKVQWLCLRIFSLSDWLTLRIWVEAIKKWPWLCPAIVHF